MNDFEYAILLQILTTYCEISEDIKSWYDKKQFYGGALLC